LQPAVIALRAKVVRSVQLLEKTPLQRLEEHAAHRTVFGSVHRGHFLYLQPALVLALRHVPFGKASKNDL
jgi:hypothetical protein